MHSVSARTAALGNDPVTVEQVVDSSCHCGENPLWHPLEQRLYWTDIDRGRMYRFCPIDRTHELVYEDRPVGGFTVQADGSLLLFRDRGNIVVWSNGKIRTTIVEQLPNEAKGRFNDVIADPTGRVFCGTVLPKTLDGRLCRIDLDGSVYTVLDHIRCSNGMGFAPGAQPRKHMYFAETMAHMIWMFDYDQLGGAVTNQRPFADFTADKLLPDGLTVDAHGDIWVAFYGASCVNRFGPSGEQLQVVRLPTSCVTCPAFGGESLSELYITTAGGQDKNSYGESAGTLLRIKPNTGGLPEHLSRIGL